MVLLSGGSLILTLFFTMIMSLVLGCGLPATAAYALVAILIAPSLIQMGIAEIPAHFFVFYFAIISAVTPPIALASLSASSIAESNFWKTAWEATKLAMTGFILPFLFIWNPILNLRHMDLFLGLMVILSILLGSMALSSTTYGYYLQPLGKAERIRLLLATLILFGFAFTHYHVLFFIGLVLFILETVKQINWKSNTGPADNSLAPGKSG